jgi:ferritin-like protein
VTQTGPDGDPSAQVAAGTATPTGAEPADGAPQGVIDLLGALAYALLVAFFRLVEDAALAESPADKAALAEMAVAEFGHFRLLRDRLQELNVDPDQAMRPFVAAIDEFHARTAPSDWLEGLVKAYVGDGIAADFFRTVAELLDPQTQELVLEVLKDTGHAGFVVARVREAIEADPRVAGRLALWARRLVGEALGQAQRVAAEREALAGLLAGDEVSQLGEIGRMFAQLTDAHARRMAALGLGE